jgi:hypothetical protein
MMDKKVTHEMRLSLNIPSSSFAVGFKFDKIPLWDKPAQSSLLFSPMVPKK